jgi:hypothetical protein
MAGLDQPQDADGLTPAATALVDELADFLLGLKHNGYDIDTGQMIAAERLLLELAARGAFPTGELRDLAAFLGPLVCHSSAEQREFPRRFDEWVRRLEQASGATLQMALVPRPDPLRKSSAGEQFNHLQSLLARRWSRVSLAILLVILVGVVASLFALFLFRPEPAATGGTEQPTWVSMWSAGLSRLLTYIGPLAAMSLLAGFIYGVWVYLRRRWVAQYLRQREEEVLPGERSKVISLPVEVNPPKLMEEADATRLARDFRRRRFVGAGVLDVSATTKATAFKGGLMSPVWATRQVTPEYLVLVDRESPRDQQARLADELISLLEANDILVDRFEYRGDPRACLPYQRPGAARGRAVMLRELGQRYPDHRLILFTDGAGLIDPFRAEVAAWSRPLNLWAERAILTPEPARDWGPRETALLAEGFHVLPATPSGLAILIERLQNGVEPDTLMDGPLSDASSPGLTDPRRDAAATEAAAGSPSSLWLAPIHPYPERLRVFPRRWLDRSPPDPVEVNRLVADLKHYLGEVGSLWLAACAVYPSIHWEFTLKIGERLRAPGGNSLLQTVPLPALARLPWFRQGTMPNWLRDRLLDELTPAQQDEVSTTIKEILVRIDPDPTRGILLDFAAQRKSLIDRVWSQWTERPLDPEDDDPRTDVVFTNFLSGKSTRRSDFAVPKPLAERLRNLSGGSAVGSVLSVLVGLGSSFAALLALVWRLLSAAYDPREYWAIVRQLFQTDRRWRKTWVREASEPNAPAVFCLRLWLTPRKWREALTEEILTAMPEADVFLIELGATVVSIRDPRMIVDRLRSEISEIVARVDHQSVYSGGTRPVILISGGLDSLLLRGALLAELSEDLSSGSEVDSRRMTPFSGGASPPSSRGPAAPSFLVFDLFPGGWSYGHWKELLRSRMPGLFAPWADFLAAYVTTVYILFSGRLMRSLRRDSPFVIDMTLQWNRLQHRDKDLPPTLLALSQRLAKATGPGSLGSWPPMRMTTYKNEDDTFRFADRLRAPLRQLLRVYSQLRTPTGPLFSPTSSPARSVLEPASNLDPVTDLTIKKILLTVTGPGKGWWRPIGKQGDATKVVPLQYSLREAVLYYLFPDILARPILSDGKFMTVYADHVARYPEAEFSVIAHGFGTFLVARMLGLYRGCVFDRVVLLGSVISRFFPWEEVLAQSQARQVVNLPASADWVSGVVFNVYESVRSADPLRPKFGKRLGGSGFGIPISWVLNPSQSREALRQPAEAVLLKGGHGAGLGQEVFERLVRYATGDTPYLEIDATFLATAVNPSIKQVSNLARLVRSFVWLTISAILWLYAVLNSYYLFSVIIFFMSNAIYIYINNLRHVKVERLVKAEEPRRGEPLLEGVKGVTVQSRQYVFVHPPDPQSEHPAERSAP